MGIGSLAVDQPYLLAAEDSVSVTVLRHPEFSTDFLIPPSGVVQIPAVGDVHVEGMDIASLSKYITDKLSARLWHPEVSVTLRQARQQRVYVLGRVKNAGVYDWKPGWSVAQALSSAGGLDLDVNPIDAQVSIRHVGGSSVIVAALTGALERQDDPALKLLPGDTLRIDAIVGVLVSVVGHIKIPGVLHVRESLNNLIGAIAQAGGVTDDASLSVVILHTDGKQEIADISGILVHGYQTRMPELIEGDTVIVPENTQKFVLLGYVTHPGTFSIPDGHTLRLSDAIAEGQGESEKRGRITRIGLVRAERDKTTRTTYNLDRYIRGGDETQNPIIIPGDILYVPQSNGVDMSVILGGVSIAAAAAYGFHL